MRNVLTICTRKTMSTDNISINGVNLKGVITNLQMDYPSPVELRSWSGQNIYVPGGEPITLNITIKIYPGEKEQLGKVYEGMMETCNKSYPNPISDYDRAMEILKRK